MLKLERIAKTLNLSITLRKREPFFNRTMLQALALGLGLHLAAFCLFPIAVSKFNGSLLILPPISVATDLPHFSEGSVHAQIEQEEFSPRSLQPPKGLSFGLPASIASAAISYPEEEVTVFYSTEREVELRHPLNELLDPSPKYDNSLIVHVSGPLSRYERAISVPTVIPEGLYRVVFHVAMENRSGKIFWYERKESSDDEKVNRLAEEILGAMHFEKSDHFVTDGEVEIIFSRGAS